MYRLDEYYTSRKTLIDLIEKQKKEINNLKQQLCMLHEKLKNI